MPSSRSSKRSGGAVRFPRQGYRRAFETWLTLPYAVTNPRAIRAHVKGDILSLKNPNSAWVEFFEGIEPFPVRIRVLWPQRACADICGRRQKGELAPITLSKQMMAPLGRQPAKKVRLGYQGSYPRQSTNIKSHRLSCTVSPPSRVASPTTSPRVRTRGPTRIKPL